MQKYILGLYDNSLIAYFSLGGQAEIVDVNAACLDLLGYKKNDLIGRPFSELLSEESLDFFELLFAQMIRSGRTKENILEVKHADGTQIKIIIDGSTRCSPDGEFVQAYCLVETSAKTQPSYRQVFNITTIPMIVYDTVTTGIVDANPAACHFYGYSYSEMTRMYLTDLNTASGEEIKSYINDILRNPLDVYIFSHKLSNGSVRIIESHPSRLVLSNKTYICSIIVDVTDKIKDQEKLKIMATLSSKLLEPTNSIEEISEKVLHFSMLLTDSEDGYVGSIDEDSKSLIIHSYSNTDKKKIFDESMNELKIKEDGTYGALWGRSLNTLKPFITNEPDNDIHSEGAPPGHIDVRNYLSFPVMLDDKLVGQIAVANSRSGFTQDDVDSLAEISNLFTLAVKGAKDKQTDALFQSIFDNMADGVAIYSSYNDEDFVFKSLNKSGLDISGLDLDNVKGRKLLDVYPGFKDSSLLKVFKEVWKTGVPQHHPLVQYVDESHSLYVENYVFKLGNKYLVAIYRDITALVEGKKALETSEAKYKSYIANSPDPILVTTKNLDIVEANEAACKKFEYTYEELLNMNVQDLWPKGVVAQYKKNAEENMKIGNFKVLHPHISKSGKFYHMQVHVNAMPDGNMVGILQDLTLRIELEDELRYINDNLQKRIDAEVDIREKQDRVLFEQKKFADMGQMINAIAHQWRQPINALGLHAQMVYEDFTDGTLTYEQMYEFKETSLQIIQHMSATIDDFRGFFQPDKCISDFEVISELLYIRKLIDAQMDMKGIKIKINCECLSSKDCVDVETDACCIFHSTKIHGYPGEFKQAIMNLIYNASDSIQEKMLSKKVNKGLIDITVKASEDLITVSISDNGSGVPLAVLGKIFNPYFTTKSEGKGTGIGLYMTKLVIEQHMNGKISAFNNPAGATFKIELPLKRN